MSHPLDRTIASDLSYECYQRQRRESQITGAPSDQGSGLTHLSRPIPVIKFWNAGEEGQMAPSCGDAQLSDQALTPVWHVHRAGRR